MEWTKEKPTELGWYWIHLDGYPDDDVIIVPWEVTQPFPIYGSYESLSELIGKYNSPNVSFYGPVEPLSSPPTFIQEDDEEVCTVAHCGCKPYADANKITSEEMEIILKLEKAHWSGKTYIMTEEEEVVLKKYYTLRAAAENSWKEQSKYWKEAYYKEVKLRESFQYAEKADDDKMPNYRYSLSEDEDYEECYHNYGITIHDGKLMSLRQPWMVEKWYNARAYKHCDKCGEELDNGV